MTNAKWWLLSLALLLCNLAHAQQTSLELTRPARPWEFIDAVGQRSAMFGNEAGTLEGWVYPLKLFRDFELRFNTADHELKASDFVREITVKPESTTITYATSTFTVKETLTAPPDQPGGLIRFDIDAFAPMQIEARFVRDFQLMWPAAVGGTFMEWNQPANAFFMSHEARKLSAYLGSPVAVDHRMEYFTNSVTSDLNTLLLRRAERGHTTQYIVFAASMNSANEALQAYQSLLANPVQYERAAQRYYSDYLARTISLELPDKQLQSAYDWSRVSVLQGLVKNPYLGTGLIAGYRTSNLSARPGFAWFFGRDSLWTDMALDAVGDYQTTKTALQFIMKYQRADGKVEHEVSQAASLVDWFKDFPYPYAAADATPLLILAVDDYVTASGDTQFAIDHWDNLWRAYQFLHSTMDADGLPRNIGVGHGWIEGGPLLPVKTEAYQSGLAAAALSSLSHLASVSGKQDVGRQVGGEAAQLAATADTRFWSANSNSLIFALDESDQQVDVPTVLVTAPMWFQVFQPAKVDATIDRLSAPDEQADWGMRIISDQNKLYDPSGYHFGSVWPLFTGWAALGEYNYHHATQAYSNLRANAQLALDGPSGHVTEVLSGSYYEALETSSPHQIWSSAMVTNPMVRGLLGIRGDALSHTLMVAPHIPADWNTWSAKHVPACGGTVDLSFSREHYELALNAAAKGVVADCKLTFSPGVSLHAKLSRLKPVVTSQDQHFAVTIPLRSGQNLVRIPLTDDFGTVVDAPLPRLGESSSNLKIAKEQWSNDHRQLTLTLYGIAGRSYTLRGYGAKISSVHGGQLMPGRGSAQVVEIRFPGTGADYVRQDVSINF